MFVTPFAHRLHLLSQHIVDSVVPMANITITILGCLTFQHESGLSYNVLATFRLPVKVTLLLFSMILCMSLVAVVLMELIWVI
jgi:hypothetical protein